MTNNSLALTKVFAKSSLETQFVLIKGHTCL